MATLTAYKGLQVVSPDPTGAGGLAIQDDFKALVDWSPKSIWAQSADPGVNDDQAHDYYPGSLWLRTNVAPPKLFVCQSSATGAAVWRQVLLEVVQDTSPQLGGDLDVNAKQIVSTGDNNIVLLPGGDGKVGLGTVSPSSFLTVGGAIATPVTTKTSAYTATGADSIIVGNASSASFTITLPNAVGIAGREYMIKRANSGANTLSVAAAAGQTIDGNATYVLNSVNDSLTVVSDNIQWRTISWNPMNVWNQTADPTTGSDQSQNFYPGSMWLRTDTTPSRLFVCQSSAAGAAVWQQLLIEVVQDPSPQLGGNLDVNGNQIVSASNGNITLVPNGTGKVGVATGAPSSTLSVNGSVSTAIATVVSGRPVTILDSVLICDATGGGFTMTLPSASDIAGRQYSFRRINTGAAKDVTIATVSSQEIDGNSTLVLPNVNSAATLVSDGANWWSI